MALPPERDIQSIETIVDDTRYRSRTEARWAIFFETLGVDFAYEP
jgi:tetrahydromethanopterin S-methyltransferase subunit F